ncbi:MAG: GMC family oxidoreductase [Alphaproteobacteria bacterium]|nr:GMC family oxidoreductase [Alphaproteobacteria bacterium]
MTDDIADILLIGAGASGAAFAWSMAETKMRIVCLEQGGWTKPTDYPTNGRDWEARVTTDFSPNPNRRGRPEDYPINDDASPIKIMNFNGVGGGTIMFTAHYPRLHPSDFRTKTLDGVGQDWPISYEQLAPYYAQNDRMTGVSGLEGDPAYPPGKKPQMRPPHLGRSGLAWGTALNKLGWHWWPSDISIAIEEYEGRAACINLAHCTPGCAQGAKASTDITYWPQALRAGVELRTHCRVKRITTDENGLATGAEYYDETGTLRFQAAHVVVVACNGIGTPRMLLNSASATHPNGLANSSDQVGRNLMLHPYVSVYGYVDHEVDGNRGPPLSLWSHEFYETRPENDFKRGYIFQIARGAGPVTEATTSFDHGRLPWGEGHHAVMRQLHYRRLNLSLVTDDLPEAHNRVTLDPVLKDTHGIPAPKVDYTIGENTQRMIRHGIEKATLLLQTAGARDISTVNPIALSGWHNLGTARMGTDPTTSVVNEWGRTHDVKNLFIIDGSLFASAGGVNPTSTIQALSLYVADQMKQRLANLFD